MQWKLCLVLMGCGSALPGQIVPDPGPRVVGYGYALPTPLYAAPGQLVTLIVQDVKSERPQTVRAPGGADLPNTLAGVAPWYWNFSPRPAPVLEVRPFWTCFMPGFQMSCAALAAITVQIPLDAESPSSFGQLRIVQGSDPGLVIAVTTLPDQVHILTQCDSFLSSPTNTMASSPAIPCPSIVAHADGSLVTVQNPARAGEAIAAYALGLGQTNPPSQTGRIVTTAAPTQTTFRLDFNYRPNALATRPSPTAPEPLYTGATPGYVGLYQINFVVPPVPAGTPPCVDASRQPASNVVQSNLTVSVGGTFSFDGARICVAIPDP